MEEFNFISPDGTPLEVKVVKIIKAKTEQFSMIQQEFINLFNGHCRVT